MASETFEQVLTAAQADGSFTPAWKKFVNTKFFVPIIRSPDSSDAKAFKLRMSDIMGDGKQSILISEVRERVEEQHGSSLAALSGADVVRMLHAEASILVALSDRAFNIAKDRVEWLKKGIEASQARARARRDAEAAAAAPLPAAPPPAASSAPAASPFPTLSMPPAAAPERASAPPAAPVRAPAPAAPAPAAAPAPRIALEKAAPAPARRPAAGPLDVAALRPRSVTLSRIGLEYFVPADWRESSLPTGMRYHDESTGSVIEATGFHRPNVSLGQWVGMRLGLVQHEMRYLRQDGPSYDIDGEEWRGRIKGQATEFVGTFPGDEAESRYLVACIRVDGTLVSVAIRAPAAVFDQNRALYKWFLSRIDINEAAAEVYRAPGRGGAADMHEVADAPALFGLSLAGRIGRLRGMAYSLVVMLPMIVLGIAAAIIAPRNFLAVGVVVGIGALVSTWFALRLMVLRLHDVNLSGKWILGFLLAIVLGAASRNVTFVAIASVIFWLASFVIYCFIPGTDGDNDFGEQPGPNSNLVIVGAGLFIFLQVASIGYQAQMSGFGNGQVPNPVRDLDRTKPVDPNVWFWTSPDRGMTIDFPGEPKELAIPQVVRDALGGGSIHQYQAKVGGRVYMVQAIDYGQPPADVYKAMQGLQESVVGTDGELLSARMNLLFNGHPGREIKARTGNGMLRSARFAIVGSKVYMAMAMSREDPASVERVGEFLDSFTIVK